MKIELDNETQQLIDQEIEAGRFPDGPESSAGCATSAIWAFYGQEVARTSRRGFSFVL